MQGCFEAVGDTLESTAKFMVQYTIQCTAQCTVLGAKGSFASRAVGLQCSAPMRGSSVRLQVWGSTVSLNVSSGKAEETLELYNRLFLWTLLCLSALVNQCFVPHNTECGL